MTSMSFVSSLRRCGGVLHAFWCIPKSLCCSSSYCRCPTCCAHAFRRNRTTFSSYRCMYTCLSLVQSYPTSCNNKYLDTSIVFSLGIARHFSSTSHFIFLSKASSTRAIIARRQWRLLLRQPILILQPCPTLRADTSRAPGLRMDNHRSVVCPAYNRLVRLTYPFATILGRYAWPAGRPPRCKPN
jgi:hypothetical protein